MLDLDLVLADIESRLLSEWSDPTQQLKKMGWEWNFSQNTNTAVELEIKFPGAGDAIAGLVRARYAGTVEYDPDDEFDTGGGDDELNWEIHGYDNRRYGEECNDAAQELAERVKAKDPYELWRIEFAELGLMLQGKGYGSTMYEAVIRQARKNAGNPIFMASDECVYQGSSSAGDRATWAKVLKRNKWPFEKTKSGLFVMYVK